MTAARAALPREAAAPVAWHALDEALVAARLGTDLASGLAEDEATRRRTRHGPNAFRAERPLRWQRV